MNYGSPRLLNFCCWQKAWENCLKYCICRRTEKWENAFIKLIVKWATQFKDIPTRSTKLKKTKVPQIFVKAMQVRNESGILPPGRHRMIRQMENLDGKEVDGAINTLPSSSRVINLVGASKSKRPGVWVPEIRLIIYSGCGPTNLALSVTLIIQWDKSKYTQICVYF